jgi:peptide/nickel transport system permease protein
MARFVTLKLMGAIVTLLFALTIAFLLSHMSGNPVYNMLGPTAPKSQIIALQRQLGLNHSFIYQYGAYLNNLVHGRLGTSLQFLQSNSSLIFSRLPNSLELLVCAIVLAIVVGVPLGIIAAIKRGTIWDRVASSTALVGQSVPIFWLGIMFILIFSVKLHWLPAGQKAGFSSFILPAVGLSLLPLAQIARLMRATMSEVLGEPYIDAAKARGLSKLRVILGHALRNSCLPVITIISLQTGTLLSGAIAVEYVFGWPGIGTLAINAIEFHDYTLIQAIVIIGVLAFVLLNFIVDLLYGIIDPRIRDSVK